jgi:hypothetical protein
MPLPGLWIDSPIAAVGDVTNISVFAKQDMTGIRPPPPVQPLTTLYWCQGDFRPVAVVKGELLIASKKLVWGQIHPDCRVSWGEPSKANRPVWRVWFLRDEGKFLRPTYDGSRFFFELQGRWNDLPSLPPAQRLGVALLTPSSVVENNEDYPALIWNLGDIACELLTKEECVHRIRALAASDGPRLRENLCDYLKAQQGQGCAARSTKGHP